MGFAFSPVHDASRHSQLSLLCILKRMSRDVVLDIGPKWTLVQRECVSLVRVSQLEASSLEIRKCAEKT